jgi:hypothetical protein
VCSKSVGIDQLLELAGDVAHEARATDEMRARLGRAESAVCWAGLLLADLAHRPRAPRLGRRGVRRRLRVRHELDGAVWARRLQMRTGRQPSVCAEKTGQVLDPVRSPRCDGCRACARSSVAGGLPRRDANLVGDGWPRHEAALGRRRSLRRM